MLIPLTLCLFNAFFQNLSAQEGPRQIEIINSDQLSFDNQSSEAKKLIGHVILKHDNAYMYCDSAYLYDAENKFEAFSNVRIVQGDSLSLTGNHLLYEGKSKMAHVDGNVHLNQKGMTLTTDRLDYDMSKKIANYNQMAKIVNGNNILYSQLGQYFSEKRELLFKKEVLLINPKYTMYTDTMKFNTSSEIAYFYGPTKIITKQKDTLYCENGWYNTKSDFAQFSKNASIISGSQQLKSDSMTFDQVTGIGKGYKKIWFTDKIENIILKGNYGEYEQQSKNAFITKEAIAIQIVDSDSIYTHADTLRYYGDTTNGQTKKFIAYNHVKVFKTDIQSASDSMSYSFSDSILRLYKNPVMWNKENQLSADTIYIYQKNQKPDYIDLKNKAFICSKERGNHFNQIKGKDIQGYFENSELVKVRVIKEGESIYYVKEDSLHYTGINQITCEDMMIFLKEKQVTGIKFYKENNGTIHPVAGANYKELRLRGFSWQEVRRPKKPEDILLP